MPISLSDAICHPEKFALRRKDIEKACMTAVWGSGIIERNQDYDQAAQGKGRTAEFEYVMRMRGESSVPVAGVDNCDCDTAEMTSASLRKQRRNNCWGWDYMLDYCRSNEDMGVIRNVLLNTTAFWAEELEKSFISELLGIYTHNRANENDLTIGLDQPAEGVTSSDILNMHKNAGCTSVFDGLIVHCDDFWDMAG